MANTIIICILLFALVFALLRAKKHFRGGGCCGSSGSTIREKKSLEAPVIGQKVLTIEGMTCENCEIRVENALNRIDGVLCSVNWKKKTATVSYSREISDEDLKATVEKRGYTVTSIRS